MFIWSTVKPAVLLRVAKFTIDLPAGSRVVPSWQTYVSVSPDSKTVVYESGFPPPNVTYVRRIDEPESPPAYRRKRSRQRLILPRQSLVLGKRRGQGNVSQGTGRRWPPVPIAPFKMSFPGDWGADGYIYWSDGLFSGIVQTPASGGNSESVTELDAVKQERPTASRSCCREKL